MATDEGQNGENSEYRKGVENSAENKLGELTTDELRKKLEDLQTHFEQLINNPRNQIYLEVANETVIGEMEEGGYDRELMERFWKRLQNETDITANWEMIAPGINRSPVGVFTRLKTDLNDFIEVYIPEWIDFHDSSDRRTRSTYHSKTRHITTNYDYSSFEFMEEIYDTYRYRYGRYLAKLAHELAHDTNHEYPPAKSTQTPSGGKDVTYAKIREIQSDLLNSNPYYIYMKELLSDLAKMETGSCDYNKKHTTSRVISTQDESYPETKNIPPERMQILAERTAALLGLGYDSITIAIALINLLPEDPVFGKQFGLNKDKWEFLDYDALTGVLRDLAKHKGGDIDDPNQLKRFEMMTKIRRLQQRTILYEELIAETKERYQGQALQLAKSKFIDPNISGPKQKELIDKYVVLSDDLPIDNFMLINIYRDNVEARLFIGPCKVIPQQNYEERMDLRFEPNDQLELDEDTRERINNQIDAAIANTPWLKDRIGPRQGQS